MHVVVSREQALEAMRYAHKHDVERSGVYDARSAAINIWSMDWLTPESRARSELIGSIYLAWNTPHADLATITQLDVEQGWSLPDAERNVDLLFSGASE